MEKQEPKDPVPESKNRSGFTQSEQVVMDKLMECYQAFIDMDREHPDEMRDFVDGVHRIQGVLGMRVLRRMYPKGWPTYK
jgi:hypothetical protein